ncbi:MAG: TrkH family potassium uptake protein, partial [Calditrichaeota bacterium]|nr:TrkH family potassium uptake protein [Calditrichota bacterium]
LSKFRDDLRPKEGFAIVAFSWIFLSFFGCLPFVFSGTIPSFTDAFFETMSGFTTTGATILTQIEGMPEGVLMWRSLTHWIGGMGIIVLSLAILPFLGVGGMQLFKAEVPGPVADKLTPRVTETAKILWGVYLVFTAAQTVLLMFGGMNLFEALCHAFGTLATGGYSTRNASVGAYGSAYIDYVIILFMLLAGTNFALHYRFLRGDFKVYFKNPEFLFYMAIIGFTSLLICINNFIALDTGVEKTFRDSLFQVVSISTTTGYGTADYEQWPFASQMILFFLMFGGGCAGSTAGGMKMIRIYVLTKFVYSEIVRLLHPHAVVPVRVGKTIINRDILMNVFGFFNLYIIIFTLSVFAMSQLGLDFSSAYGAVVATMSNIGPGLGSVGPTDNFAHIPAIGKWLLSFLMMMGRLELFTVVILFSPSFWRK